MKKYLLIILLLPTVIFSQEITINLSIEWKDDLNENVISFNKSQNSFKPYLKITYKNLSDKNLYFFKYNVNDQYNNPKIVSFCQNIEESLFSDLDSINFNNNHKTRIKLGDHFLYSFNDDPYSNISECNDVMNYIEKYYFEIWMIEEYGEFYKNKFYINSEKIFKKYLTITKEPISDITTLSGNLISNELSEYFVFLKKGKEFIEFVNLEGFEKIGGSYIFELEKTERIDYKIMKSDNQDYNIAGTQWKKIYYPKVIDSYHLFIGKVLTNSIYVEF